MCARYLKRGVSDTGKVANDVEVEQVRPLANFCFGSGAKRKFSYVRSMLLREVLRFLQRRLRYLSIISLC